MPGAANILIADDNASFCETMSLILREHGYGVATAGDGIEAVEKAKETRFDVIFMDVRMPVMDGVAAHRKIREIRPEAVVVMMTAYSVEDLVQQALEGRAREILHKPLDVERVIDTVKEVVGAREGAQILVVDDDPGICTTLRDILADRGCRVAVAGTGEEALAMARETAYDIIFIDVKLPTINGLETYLAIRELNPNATAVIMTAYREETAGLVEEALNSHASTCLYKPFDMDQVVRLVDELAAGPEAAVAARGDDTARPCSILVVDDDEATRSSLSLVLHDKGYGTGTAGSGREALAKVKGGRFVLALVDIRLPDLDGVELVRSLKEADPDMEVVLVTGYADLETALRAMNRGASGYMVKPLDMEEVLATVGRICERQRLIQERRGAEEALREREELYRSLVDTIPHGIEETDAAGTILYTNSAHCRQCEYDEGELIGKSVFDIVADDAERETLRDYLAFLVREQPSPTPYFGQRSTKSGRVIDVQVDWDYRRDAGGRVVGFTSVVTDITDRKRAEQLLAESEERFRVASSIASDVVYERDARTGEATFYGDIDRRMGYEPGGFPRSISGWLEHVHPDDLRVMGECALKERGPEGSQVLEYRMRRRDGTYARWQDRFITLPADTEGGPEKVIGVATEVTRQRKAEESLRESEEKYRTLFETMAQGVIYQVADGTIVTANPAAERILGLTLDQMTGRTPGDLHLRAIREDGSYLPGDENPSMVALETGQDVRDVVIGVFNPQEGGYRWMNVSAAPQYQGGQEKPHQVYTTFTDITPRMLMEESLRQSEEKFRNIVESTPMGMHMYQLESDGRLTFIGANPAANEMLALDHSQFVGKTIEDAFPSIGTDVPERYRRAAARGEPWRVDRIVYEDERITGAFQVDAFQTSPGRMVATFLDITERKRMEEDLRREKEFSEGLISSMLDGIVVIDHSPVITHVNPAFCQMTGFARDELIGTGPPFPFWPPEEHEAMAGALKKSAAGDFANQELTLMRKNGERFPVTTSPSWVVDRQGNVVCNFVTVQEITERKRMEATLRDALAHSERREAEISALLDGSRAVLVSHKFDDAARSIFDTCKGLLGAEAGLVLMLSEDGREDEVLLMDLGGLPCAVDRSLPLPIRGLRGEVYGTGEAAYDNDFTNSDWAKFMPAGHAGLDSVLFAPMVIGHTTVGLLGFANKPGGFSENDARLATAFGELAAISLRNSWALESLEDSEERFRFVVVSAGDAIISYDSQGSIMSWNRAAQTVFGYSAAEVVGRSLACVVPERLREDYEAGMSPLLSPGEASTFAEPVETVGLREGGIEFPMELTVATWRARGGIFLTAIARDITHRKQAEARLEGMYHREKMLREQVEEEMRKRVEFTRALAHELKTPLTPVVMSSQILTQNLEDETLLRVAKNIERGASNLNSRIDELLDLARGDVGMLQIRTERTDVLDLLREVVDEVSPVPASREQTLVLKLPPGMPPEVPQVMVDRGRVKQVVMNLLNNAFKYTPEGGTITLSARRDEADLIVEIGDTGPGMAKEEQGRIFNPYHRIDSDRERLSGLGLGLALCKTLVELHGGRIWVNSREGKGSTFGFSLPINGIHEEQAE